MITEIEKIKATAASIVDAIDEFEKECEDRSHTDIGDAWDLLGEIRKQLDEVR